MQTLYESADDPVFLCSIRSFMNSWRTTKIWFVRKLSKHPFWKFDSVQKKRKKKVLELWLETICMRYAFVGTHMPILSSKVHFIMPACGLMLTDCALLLLEKKNLLSQFSLKIVSSYQKKNYGLDTFRIA